MELPGSAGARATPGARAALAVSPGRKRPCRPLMRRHREACRLTGRSIPQRGAATWTLTKRLYCKRFRRTGVNLMPIGVGASRYWSELARPDSKLQLRLSFDHLLCGRRETAHRAVHALDERSGGLGVRPLTAGASASLGRRPWRLSSTIRAFSCAGTYDVALDVFSTPLRRTMTLTVLAVGLDKTLRGGAVVCLNTNCVGTSADGHDRHLELSQRLFPGAAELKAV